MRLILTVNGKQATVFFRNSNSYLGKVVEYSDKTQVGKYIRSSISAKSIEILKAHGASIPTFQFINK